MFALVLWFPVLVLFLLMVWSVGHPNRRGK
jgi:hypothetical protein